MSRPAGMFGLGGALFVLLCVPQTRAADSSAATEGVQEIVVTAQRLPEAEQGVPISVTAYDSADLQRIGATQSDDLPFMVPGLQMQPVGAFQPMTVRGVGNNGTGAAVLRFIDGVYYPFQTGSMIFNNVVSVEVDKGPQGTLFGRNSTGGVVQITTRDPSSTPSADVAIGYGNFDTQTASLYATAGVAPRLAGDIAVNLADQKDGWGRNLLTGADVFRNREDNFRSKWLFDATDTTRLRLIVDYDTDDGSEGTIVKPAAGHDEIFNYVNDTLSYFPDQYDVDANFPPHYTTQTMGANFRIETDADAFRVSSTTSWQRQHTNLYIDYDGTPIPFFNLYRHDAREAETEELQVSAKDGSAVRWVTGLFLYNDSGIVDPFQFSGIGANAEFGIPGGAPFNLFAKDRVTSYALYGQGSAPIGFDSTLTLGARYTIDEDRIGGYLAGGDVVIPGTQGDESRQFDKLTFRVGLDHYLSTNTLGYLSFNRGFDAGIFNLISTSGFTPAENAPVNPETIDAYELGIKSEVLDKRLRINAAAFLYNYRNLQQQIYQSDALITVNAAAARITGMDLDLEARPVGNFTVAVSTEFLHGIFTRYPDAPFYSTGPLGELDTSAADATDKYIPNAPRLSATARATYTVPSPVGAFDSTVAVNYVSFWYADPSNYYQEPSHSIVNASEMWTSSDGRQHVSVWGKNLANSYYDMGINMLAPVGPVGNPGAPRTFGITYGYHF